MFKSTLVAQLLTFVLDARGVDMMSVMEMFPEEFTPRAQRSESPARLAFPWTGASTELTDSVRFLEARHLIEVRADGSIVPAGERADARWSTSTPRVGVAEVERGSPSEMDEGFGYEPVLEWTGDRIRLAEPVDPLDFDQPRFES